jgi:hypothetical protein
MNSGALFGLSVLMNFVASGIVTKLYIRPWLRVRTREEALLPLMVPHMFRFVGLSFLVPGVVSASLSPDFARPAAYGDLVAALLAVVTLLALSARASWALGIVWVFNLWGTSICCMPSTRARSVSASIPACSAPRFIYRPCWFPRFS